MSVLYFDCFSGISGDMIVGSLLDLGLPLEALSGELDKLTVKNYTLTAAKTQRANMTATKFDVQAGHEHAHRNYFIIEEIVKTSDLSPWVKEQATRIFLRLGEAEAKVHGTTLQNIHFHEVGAVDAIVDVVGACIAFEMLEVKEFRASALNVGKGQVRGAHGVMPVPAPATAELLQGIPIYSNEVEGELVTPTGAAILSTLCQQFGEMPPLRVQSIGYGAGSRDLPDRANVLRVFLGELAKEAQPQAGLDSGDSVTVIEANIDDMNPQIFGHLQEIVLESGALDFWACPIQMKKNRPGILLTIVIPPALLESISRILFQETTTIGIRYHETRRKVLERQIEQVESEWGPVAVKVSKLDGKVVNFSPEYEDCRRLARLHRVPYKLVQSRIVQRFMNRQEQENEE